MERKESDNGRKKNVTGEGSVNVNKNDKVNGGPVSGNYKKNGSTETPKPQNNDPDKGLVGDLAGAALNSVINSAANNAVNSLANGLGGGSSSKKKSGGLSKILKLVLIVVALVLVFRFLKGSGCLGGGDPIGNESYHREDSYNNSQSSQESYQSQESYNIVPTVNDKQRDYYTDIHGNKNDTVTVMIYMCGTDLESQYGLATADLVEITKASSLVANNGKVNVIVQTGGCQKWQNNIFSNRSTQRYSVNSQGVTKLQDLGSQLHMTKASTLSDFIQFCKKNFEANRYMLIFWDHGGGSVSGYGYDQNYQSDGSMTIDQIDKALTDGGVKFDFIGFDACLMATYETAVMCENHADFLIASEEPEPGYGWYYTDWINMLAKNPSVSTKDLGTNIVDTYISHCKTDSPGSPATLSLIDLKKMAGSCYSKFNAFAQSINLMVSNNDYRAVSAARANAKEFSPSNRLDQVDLINFLEKLDSKEARSLASALKGAIVYNKANENNANGVSIYFPYQRTAYASSMAKINNNIGLDPAYTQAIKSFASVATGGQVVSSSSGNAFGSLTGSGFGSGSSVSSGDISGIFDSFFGSGSSSSSSSGLGSILDLFGSSTSSGYSSSTNDSMLNGLGGSYGSLLGSLFGGSSASSSSSGFDMTSSLLGSLFGSEERSMMRSMTDYYAENYLDASRMGATYKNGVAVLELTDEEWDLVNSVALNLYIADKDGFIDLGIDNVYRFDKDGDLVLEGGDTWLGLNGQVCAYYFDSYDEKSGTTTGFVPVLWNNKRAQLFFVSDKNGNWTFSGVKFLYENETSTVAKDMIQIGQTDAAGNVILKNGSTIKLICDYYDKDGNYQSTYSMGSKITFDGTLTLSDLKLNLSKNQTASVTYRLTDIYNNQFWTEAVEP